MSLQQALERLRAPHPAVQAAAVAAVFELAARAQSATQRDAALAECLSHGSQVGRAITFPCVWLPLSEALPHHERQPSLSPRPHRLAGRGGGGGAGAARPPS